MGLNEVDDYFRKDTELQNYTKTGVKRIKQKNTLMSRLMIFLLTVTWGTSSKIS